MALTHTSRRLLRSFISMILNELYFHGLVKKFTLTNTRLIKADAEHLLSILLVRFPRRRTLRLFFT